MFKKLFATLGLMGLTASTSSYVYSCSKFTESYKKLTTNDYIVLMDTYLMSIENNYFDNYKKIINDAKDIISNREDANHKLSPIIYYSEDDVTAEGGILIKFDYQKVDDFNFTIALTIKEIPSAAESESESYEPQKFNKTYSYKSSQTNELVQTDKQVYSLTQNQDPIVKVKILNRNLFNKIIVNPENKNKELWDKFYFDDQDPSLLYLKFKKNEYKINLDMWFDLTADNSLSSTKIRVDLIYLDTQNLHVKKVQDSNNWGEKVEWYIENMDFYENLTITAQNENGQSEKINFKKEDDNISFYLLFNNDVLNTFSKEKTKISFVISANNSDNSTTLDSEIPQFNPLGIHSYNISILPNTLKSLKISEKIKNLKINFENNLSNTNLIFLNGIESQKSVDFTNEKYFKLTAWIKSKVKEEKYKSTITCDLNFVIDDKVITKKFSADFNIIVNEYRSKNKYTIKESDFKIKSQSDQSLTSVFNEQKQQLIINTNASKFDIDLDTDILRMSNSNISFVDYSEDGEEKNINYNIPYQKQNPIKDYTTLQLSFDQNYFASKKEFSLLFTCDNFKNFELLFQYRN
ncbi:hypothetical protein SHELI_v1c04100 [Spiroplasma helicoides]|uniref:Lipoprotein-associated type-17 domain-containing protein n=1 Tax=Spiroplasma helicoides TaxID=216938 RepID=A0A1B3SKA8_9MOLU|nr:hypothetical protein [Spiroplasma helicoides]AOG60361.1 hypothetical protein SHELI_v1c04100 [Spiroplasma helicoides]